MIECASITVARHIDPYQYNGKSEALFKHLMNVYKHANKPGDGIIQIPVVVNLLQYASVNTLSQ